MFAFDSRTIKSKMLIFPLLRFVYKALLVSTDANGAFLFAHSIIDGNKSTLGLWFTVYKGQRTDNGERNVSASAATSKRKITEADTTC